MTLAEALTELDAARKQLQDSLAGPSADSVLIRRACRVILRLCAVVFVVAGGLRDTRVDLLNCVGNLTQLRADFDAYVASHP